MKFQKLSFYGNFAVLSFSYQQGIFRPHGSDISLSLKMKAYKKHQFSYQILSFHSNTKPWKKTAMASLIQCTSPVSHRRITSVLSSHPRCFPQIRNSETLFVVNPSVFSGNGKKPFTNAEFECNSGVSDISDTNKASEINHSKLQQSKAEAIAHSKSKLLVIAEISFS